MAVEMRESRKGYVVAKTAQDAFNRFIVGGPEKTPEEAWAALGYWEVEEHSHEYKLFNTEYQLSIVEEETN